jgi:hypothetical protein
MAAAGVARGGGVGAGAAATAAGAAGAADAATAVGAEAASSVAWCVGAPAAMSHAVETVVRELVVGGSQPRAIHPCLPRICRIGSSRLIE